MKVRKLKRKIKLKSKIFNFFLNNDIPLKNIDFAKKHLKNLGKNAIILKRILLWKLISLLDIIIK